MTNQESSTRDTFMGKQEIAKFYWNLPNGEKGRFIAICTIEMGGSPYSWQHKFLRWYSGKERRPITPLESQKIGEIIRSGKWKLITEGAVI